MKHLYSLSLLLLALMLPATARAHDFYVNGIYYNINGNEVTVTYRGTDSWNHNTYSGDVTIPATVTYGGTTYSVTSIGDYAFYDCSDLSSITIPNSVTTIGYEAFRGCSILANIDIPNSVSTVGNLAFADCSSLNSITIPNSVTSIGNAAFYNCWNLTSVTIPNSVTSIGGDAFVGCSALTSIVVAEENSTYDSRNNCNAIIETSSNTLVIGCKNSTIPNSVTSIGGPAFFGCSGLTNIEIPNSVTSIGYGAFAYCSGLTYIFSLALVPPTITDSFTFYNCSGALYVPDLAVEAYKADPYWSIFANIIGMPYTFEVDGTNYHTTTMNTVSVMANGDEGLLYTGDVVIPDSVTYEGYTFAVTGIESNAFDGCFELTSITIPNSIETIGGQAFQGCTGLTSVTIGSGVTAIGAKAFNYCNALETVKCLGTVPPVMASTDCFSTAAYNRATLLVPRNTEATYTAADYWYKFAHIDGWGSAGRGDIDGDGVVSINDVTRMIDAILTGDYEGIYVESADLNSNGRLDIGDVTTIIDMLLNDIR